MAGLTDSDKKAMLVLARSAIAARLIKGIKIPSLKESVKESGEKRGCFVSLHKKGSLRGCIGTLEPTLPLAEGIEENAKSAAFHDPRFLPLTREELDQVDIEISILTEPISLKFKDGEDLKRQLKAGLHGVILARGRQRATFLPQVWDQLPDKEEFLGELCRKAGMDRFCWKRTDVAVSVYEVVHFSEKKL
ncbi:MAG: AmmeMemoRadiSam system protein A [Thermodesulfobacteriota bacterium]